MMGGALGLAILASLAASRSETLVAAGEDQLAALTGGYHAAFVLGAVFAVVAAVLSAALLRGDAGSAQATEGGADEEQAQLAEAA